MDHDETANWINLTRQSTDWSQAGTLVREVIDYAARERLVGNVVGHLTDGVSEKVLLRAFDYWRNIDGEIGNQIEAGVREKIGGKSKDLGLASAKSISG